MKLSVEELVQITGGQLISLGDSNVSVTSIEIDSRKVTEDSLFVPFKGEKVDAHKFIANVLKTAKVSLTEETVEEIEALSGQKLEEGNLILVPSTLDALQAIGRYERSKFSHPMIGVTGSVGKTTTREIITDTLASGLKVFHTEGNNNSQIGVPLTLARINNEEKDIAVLEMGISEPGGMDKLVSMVRPNIAVVTMIGVAHIEFMKTKEGIRKEKLRIISQMNQDGMLFLNTDDELLREIKDDMPVKTYTFGTSGDADYQAKDIVIDSDTSSFTLVYPEGELPVIIGKPGRHIVLDSLAGFAIAHKLGLDMKKAAEGLKHFAGLRQKHLVTSSGVSIIDDSYNASPASMKASLDVLADVKSNGRKIAVLGDMFELGENSDAYHQEVGQYVAEKKMDQLFAVGESAKLYASEAKKFGMKEEAIHYISDVETLTSELKSFLQTGDSVLIKASNGMHLSKVSEALMA